MYSKLFDETEKGKTFSGFKTIYEAHRQIYDLLVTELHETAPDVIEKIIPVLEEAYLLGIKIVNKLIEYKLKETEFYDETHNSEKVLERRRKRMKLIEFYDGNVKIMKKEQR